METGSLGVSWTLMLFFLGGGGLVLAEGNGLKAGKSWAVFVPLLLCLAATFGLGLWLVSDMSSATPITVLPFAFLLAADLFFVMVQCEWNKQRRSLR